MSIASARLPHGAAEEIRIGEWRLAARRNELLRGDEVVKLEPKAIEVLAHLARHAGEVVGREDLLAKVWPGVVVGDDALTQAIIKLRKALGDDAHAPKYIETISKRGYRLIAPTSAASPSAAAREPGRQTARRWGKPLALGAAAIVGIVVAASVAVPRLPWPVGSTAAPSSAPGAIPTIAVLPFDNLSGDPRREYLGEGLTEDMINALGRFSGVRVMSRRAVEPYKGKAVAPALIRNELGARYIVHGSVREAGGKVRVSVELSDAESGALLASETHEANGAELFDVQDRIVGTIVGKLHVKLTHIEQQRASSRPTDSLEAYQLVLRARALLNRNDRAANREARVLLARAQELAPQWAEVRSTLGVAEFQRYTDGWVEDAAEAARRAEQLAKEALASPDSRAHVRAHSLLASIYGHQDRYAEALAHARSAIDLNPSDATALWWLGSASLSIGRVDEAIALLETARRFEPRPSAGMGLNLAIAYYVAGRHTDALMQAEALLAVAPRHVYSHAMRAATLSKLGRHEEARAAAGQVRRVDPLFDPDNFGSRFENPKYTALLREGLRGAGL